LAYPFPLKLAHFGLLLMSTFLGLPQISLEAVSPGDIVVLGARDATPYEMAKPSHARGAPDAIRSASARYASWHQHHDFDVDGPMLEVVGGRAVDAGDIATDPAMPGDNRRAIAAAVRQVLDARAAPVVLGGDDSVPIPVLSAYERHGPIWIVQIDAHIDWRDERDGERMGWSSPMRRASEMPWVEGIIQIGARGVGSATRDDIQAARQWGARIVPARQVHAQGVQAALAMIPNGAKTFVTLDCDALDPSVMPGVGAPVPGGRGYWNVVALFEELAARTRIAGFDIVELVPERDVGGLSALMAARFVTLAIGAIDRSARPSSSGS
jgi:agmatinase